MNTCSLFEHFLRNMVSLLSLRNTVLGFQVIQRCSSNLQHLCSFGMVSFGEFQCLNNALSF